MLHNFKSIDLRIVVIPVLGLLCFLAWNTVSVADTGKPEVGDNARNFSLKTSEGKEIELKQVLKEGPVVLVVLRGYPGYQCPLCTKQVASLIQTSKKFRASKASVLLIYPGAADDLKSKSKEFLKDTNLPKGFELLLDPDYQFTDQWDLRWDAPSETAYPSTFIIDSEGVIKYAKISDNHGDRSDADELALILKD